MDYKMKKALKRNKKYYSKYIALYVALALFMVLPLTVTILDGTVDGKIDLTYFVENIANNILNVFKNLGELFSKGYFFQFVKNLGYFTIAFFIFMFFGVKKLKPKSEYEEIEHGSSGWAEKGEQYSVLNKKEGIILAEDNYLPVDKIGNVNVMIVGRIWCW